MNKQNNMEGGIIRFKNSSNYFECEMFEVTNQKPESGSGE